MRRGKHAHQHVDLFLIEQPLGFVDRHLGFALGIGINGHDFVAFNTTALINHIDGVLGTQIARS